MSESDPDDGEAAPVLEQPARRPGRPSGTFGSRAEHDLQAEILARHGLAAPDSRMARLHLARNASQATRQQQADPSARRLQVVLQDRGVSGQLARAASLVVPLAETDPDVKATADEYLGEKARVLMGSTAHASGKPRCRSAVQGHVHDLAACVHFGSVAWISAACVALLAEIKGGRARAVAAGRFSMYDETSFLLRNLIDNGMQFNPLLQCLTNTAKGHSASDGKHTSSSKRPGYSKVVQAEGELFFVFEYKQQIIGWIFPLTCPLQVVDRGTGETMRGNSLRLFSIPGLEALEEQFPVNIGAACADRASCNDRCETSLATESGKARLRLPCVAHIGSTTQGHAFSVIDPVIAGIIASSLTQQGAHSAEKLRRCIACLLFRSCVPVDGPMPEDEEPHRVRLAAVLDLCLRKDQAGQARRMVIWWGMTGDTTGDAVYWNRPQGREGLTDSLIWDWVPNYVQVCSVGVQIAA